MSAAAAHGPMAPPERDAELRVSGLSLLFYDFYLINCKPNIDLIQPLSSPYHYKALFDFGPECLSDHEIYLYHQPLIVTPIQLPHARIMRGTARLLFQIVAQQFLLATTVVNIDRSSKIIDEPKLQVDKPLRVDDILTMINELNEPEGSLYRFIAEQKNRAVFSSFGAYRIPANAAPEQEECCNSDLGHCNSEAETLGSSRWCPTLYPICMGDSGIARMQ